MAQVTGRVSAVINSPVSGRVRDVGVPASAASILLGHGPPARSVGWVVHSDSSHIDSAGFPRPVQSGCGRAGVGLPVRPRAVLSVVLCGLSCFSARPTAERHTPTAAAARATIDLILK